MPASVFVTGATGFVGSAMVRQVVASGLPVRALVNRRPISQSGDVTSIPGGMFDAEALWRGMDGCQAIVHTVGIIRENERAGITFERIHVVGTRNVVDAACKLGVRRFILISALGTRENAPADYHRTKWLAEEYLRNSGLDWTIFQPSIIHGPGGELMDMESKWARGAAPLFLFMPYFAGGVLGLGRSGMLQPVYVRDVAKAVVECMENPLTFGRVYELVGNERITWPQLHQAVARALLDVPRKTMAIPAWLARTLTNLVPARLLPFNRDQVTMSREDNVGDPLPFRRDFGWAPDGFAETLARYVPADIAMESESAAALA